MNTETNHFAKAEMLIRKPINQVFQVIIDPEITTKFWFTKSSGKLEEGIQTKWTWEMYNHSISVKTNKIVDNKKIVIEWNNYDTTTTVEWTFKDLGNDGTFVSIEDSGFYGDIEKVISQLRGSTEGFTLVLAGFKAYLEHNMEWLK
jgi:uncharacterized protein YndB with AHSA1/START domain